MILGIDPGTTESAFAVVGQDYALHHADKVPNERLVAWLKGVPAEHVAIESLHCYGMPVGREVFETAYLIGRLVQVCKDRGIPVTLYPRPEYARRICGVGKVTDSVLRQALLLRFGDDRKGGPLHCLKGASDKRSAFAVAAYHLDVTGGPGRAA